jgi:hypothetical protein
MLRMAPPGADLVVLSRDERDTLGRLAASGLTTAGELIEWAEGLESWSVSAAQVREGVARALVISTLLDAASTGVVDLGTTGLRGWLDGYAGDVITTLDDDRLMLHHAQESAERVRAEALVDQDLDALLLVRRLRDALARSGR